MNFKEEHALETYRSLISISMQGLKTLLLINGGAVVAVLTYLGHSVLGPKLTPHVWWPLGWFVAGVVFSAFAFLSSYATQFALFNESIPSSTYKGPRHMTFLWITVGLIILSLVCFASGAILSVSVLSKYAGPP